MSQTLTSIANRVGSDKGTTNYCAHGYTRVYESLLAPVRQSPLRLAEIGLVHPRTMHAAPVATGCPSLEMWAEYLPNARIFGFDILDFTALSTERMHIVCGDQGSRDDLVRFGKEYGPFDILIDDGSHASHHQQISLATLFPFVTPGGLYIIEDLHFQPAEVELNGITPTRELLRSLRHGLTGAKTPLIQAEFSRLSADIRQICFFDSLSPLWPLSQLEDAIAVLTRHGRHPHLSGASR